MMRLIKIVAIALFILLGVIYIKFDLVYEVIDDGKKLGYVKDKVRFEQSANDIINENNKPKYQLTFVTKKEEVEEEKVLAELKQNIETKNTEKSLEIAKAVSNTQEKKATSKKVTSRGNSITTSASKTTQKEDNSNKNATTKTTSTKEVTNKTKKVASLNGVKFTVKPIAGTITSRFGGRESIRTSSHTGLDIAAPKGTDIKVAADGEVIFSGYSGGYGKVVKVSHGNGIKTYYGHCSKLYVKEGQKVSAGDVIAAVGSTGRSTGNHLHFEILKNGVSLNPQNYLY